MRLDIVPAAVQFLGDQPLQTLQVSHSPVRTVMTPRYTKSGQGFGKFGWNFHLGGRLTASADQTTLVRKDAACMSRLQETEGIGTVG